MYFVAILISNGNYYFRNFVPIIYL